MSANMIKPDSDGFDWEIEGYGKGRIKWEDVRYVEVFKKDLLTTDVVCMNLRLVSSDWFLLTDEVTGFVELVRTINRLWDLGEEWYGKVLLPPFESCKVVITPPSEATARRAVLEWQKP